MTNSKNFIRYAKNWWKTHVVAFFVLCSLIAWLVVSGVLTILNWEWLSAKEESNAATIRNLSLVVGGVAALVIACWRSVVAAQQVVVAQRQAETAERGLLNERYQRGAEMMGSEVPTVRLGGIFALQSLDEDHIEQYHVEIMKLFMAFLPYVATPFDLIAGADAE